MDFKIAVIKGDGIGPEIVDATLPVLAAVGEKYGHSFQYQYLLAGGAALDDCGIPLPQATIDACRASDAVLLGAVGDPKWDSEPGSNRPEMAILGLREALGLFANLRPAMVWRQLAGASPLRPDIISDGLNILIVRELTGGIYFGTRGTETVSDAASPSPLLAEISAGKTLPAGRFAFDVEQYSEMEVSRIAKLAFEMAQKRSGHVTSVDKSNVLDSSRLWHAVVEEVHAGYADVRLDHMYVDNASQQLIKNPQHFDVLVTTNMFGDILSDEASQITGSIGMLPSASLGEGSFGLYEPIHGSAPKYAGQDRANPIATILSAAMMLRFTLSLGTEADAIESAVSDFLDSGYRTPDIATEGTKAVGTQETGRLIASYI
ncbi:MAG: 3-isopropylmalate dehydrogenase [Clostridiales Family XIII bacterium]|jgi:3-isopropylmalate dehydrogenase|nr:3-isopropylmalate dehydrogenase [Clostridiales Family XIII bacterium]